MRTLRLPLYSPEARYSPLVAAVALALSPCGAQAASFLVKNNADLGANSLRQAITDANASCASGDKINFVGGPFTIAVATALPTITCPGLSINGDGSNIVASGPISGDGLAASTSPPVSVSNLDVSGFTYGSCLAGAIDSTGTKVHGCSTGITTANGAKVIGNQVYSNNNNGIYVSYGGATIDGNTVYANASNGVEVQSGSATIVRNTIGLDKSGLRSGNGSSGVYLSFSASTVSDNTISGNATGVNIDNDQGSTISGNRIGTNASGTSLSDGGSGTTGNTFDGIHLNSSFSYGTSISGNTIAGSGLAVDLNNFSSVSVTGNFINTDGAGTGFLGGSNGIETYCGSGITANGNVIATDFGGTGIRMLASGGSSTVSANKIGLSGDGVTPLGNNSYGVILDSAFCGDTSIPSLSSSVTIDGNTIGNQTVYGVGLLYGADNITVSGNTIKNARVTGVRMLRVTGSITGNTVSGNTIQANGDGIQLNADLADIVGNSIIGNTGAGVSMGNANTANITGNTISANASYGIDLQVGVNNQMIGNLISGNAGSILPAAGQKNINLAFPGSPRPINSGGPNNGQNYPVINSVVRDIGNNWTLVSFTLDAPVGTYQVDIFGNNPATTVPGGNVALGNTFLPIGVAGPTSGSFAIPGLSADSISLLATHVASMETSEFSPVVNAAGVPGVSISPPSLDFGTVAVGANSGTRTITITSNGSADYRIDAAGDATCTGGAICSSGQFTCTTTCAPGVYTPGQACQVAASFHPLATGPFSTTIALCDNVTDYSKGPSRTITISGNGVVAPSAVRVDIDPIAFDFGSVLLGQTSTARTFTIRNSAASSANVSSVTGSPGFIVNTSSCGGTLPAGASCLATVSFTPTRLGSISGLLTVAGTSATLGTASLSGAGVQQVTLDLPTAIDFGAYTSGAAALRQTVTLRPSGNAVLSIASLFVTGPFALGNGCPPSLLPGDSCTVTLDFSAPVVGDYQGSLVIATNAVGGSGAIALTAHTVAAPVPQIQVTPTSIGFGDRLLGVASPTQRVTITNVGNAAATLAIPTTTNGDFLVTSTCGSALLPTATCFADVSFRPVGFGPRSGQLLVNSNAPVSPIAVGLSGRGCPPVLSSMNRQSGQRGCAP
ncbi:MAG: choice-of-anchor D domain-containing protein [Usitatibacter sp.]